MSPLQYRVAAFASFVIIATGAGATSLLFQSRRPIPSSDVIIAAGPEVTRAGDLPSRHRLGEKVDLPPLQDSDGKKVELPAGKPVVVAFLSFDCPVARDYVGVLSRMASDRGSKVTFVGFVPTDDPPAEFARHVREFGATFQILADRRHEAVAALQAGHTPEVFVLDGDGLLRYRGRVDDRYGARLKPNARVTRHDLKEAIDAVLTGKPVETPVTTPVGCPIPALDQSKATDGPVTYYRDVLPILQARCQECHRKGEVGPFSLMTYKEAFTRAEDIKEYTASRKMPPWKANDGLPFQHDRRLPAHEIKTLAEWVDCGKPAGEPKDAPPARTFATGWSLGEPDLVLTMDDMRLAGNGPDRFQCVVLPTGLAEDRFVVAFEVRPGNSKVVHHVIGYFDTTGSARKMAREAEATGDDRGPGYESPMGIGFTPDDPEAVGGMGGWTPGMRGVKAHAGTGLLLPKGSDVVLQIHYHRTGMSETDRTRIGLYFAKEKNLKQLRVLAVPGLVSESDGHRPFDVIPADRSAHRVAGKVLLEEDCDVYSVLPHMHMLGTKIRVTASAPGGWERSIVVVDQWDYGWQENYQLVDPLPLKAGTVLTVEAEYDNSAKNPLNPSSPPKDVRRGEGTTDEMLFAFLRVAGNGVGPVKFRLLTDRADYQPSAK
ncbi:MAG TPA: redoxin family protein [Gemmataceae bacterium]|nr:redoxin family protein [Gemmataceae bacterium]